MMQEQTSQKTFEKVSDQMAKMPDQNKKRLFMALWVLLILLSAFTAVKIYSEIKKDSMLGEGDTPATVSFSGHGEVTAVPDIASVYFTISKDDKTVKAAQDGVAAIEKKALDALKAKGVADEDIQTADASFYPKYQYRQGACLPVMPMDAGTGTVSMPPSYCPGGKQVIVGYTASESITVKVRDTDTVGALMQDLSATGVTNLSGPNFSIDNPDGLKLEARKKAIDDAKSKADSLAKDLGVHLGRIIDYTDSNGGYPIMYSAKDAYATSAQAPAPATIPKGENTISSDITITYEIK